MTEASRTDDRPEYRAHARALRDALAALVPLGAGSRTVVGIAGETGSGKSVAAASLARVLGEDGVRAVTLHQDDYFLRPPRVNHAHRERDLASVGPHEVDLALVARHVAEFRAGRDGVAAPLVDYPSDSFLTRHLDFGPADVLVVEGTYALMVEGLDARVFLEATHEDTAARRRARNRDIDAPFVQQVLRIEHDVVVRQARTAHLLVDRDFRIRRGPHAP